MDKKQLTPQFNAKCYKDFKVGKRTRPDGTVNLWQGNKLVGVIPAKTSMFIDNASSILQPLAGLKVKVALDRKGQLAAQGADFSQADRAHFQGIPRQGHKDRKRCPGPRGQSR